MSAIALLATGDELTKGDILNTNGQVIAQALTEVGLPMGTHVVAGDHEETLIKAIQFLLSDHDILIIIGGLGPTTDDRTRFALSAALQEPLEFSNASWERIVTRLQNFGLTAPENNRQQALFPAHAIIYPNPNGTADACMIAHKNKLIFMLPGPPSECLPLFQEQVLPAILKNNKLSLQKILRWRVFGVSEGHIADQLEIAIAGENIIPGYRVDYPYIEFKCPVSANQDRSALIKKIETLLAPHFLSDPYRKASDILQETLTQTTQKILIQDHATQGLLESLIHNPATHRNIRFQTDSDFQPDVIFTLTGLKEYWDHQLDTKETKLVISKAQQGQTLTETKTIPYRPNRVLLYAAEYLAHYINKCL